MTYLTPASAKDEIYGLVTTAFNAWLADAGETCELRYQGRAKATKTLPLFVHFSMQQVLSTLKAFVQTEDRNDKKVYETSGLFFAQVNVGMAEQDSFRRGDLIATALRDMVRDVDTPSGVSLRNARFNELPSDTQSYRWNVIAEYEYDEAA